MNLREELNSTRFRSDTSNRSSFVNVAAFVAISRRYCPYVTRPPFSHAEGLVVEDAVEQRHNHLTDRVLLEDLVHCLHLLLEQLRQLREVADQVDHVVAVEVLGKRGETKPLRRSGESSPAPA